MVRLLRGSEETGGRRLHEIVTFVQLGEVLLVEVVGMGESGGLALPRGTLICNHNTLI